MIGADGQIGGFTIMNDWSARDLQRREMRIGLGPAKGKDFATSLGPIVVTPDELGDLRLEMVARVNGEERSRGNLGDMYHSWEAILAHASRNTELRPGDILGSGTVGTGCILEHGDGRWLQPGDEVELEVEGIGVCATGSANDTAMKVAVIGAGVMGLADGLGAEAARPRAGDLRAVRDRQRARLEPRALADLPARLCRGRLRSPRPGGTRALA